MRRQSAAWSSSSSLCPSLDSFLAFHRSSCGPSDTARGLAERHPVAGAEEVRPPRVDGKIQPVAVAHAYSLRLRQDDLQIRAAGLDVDDRQVAKRLDEPDLAG